MAKPREVDYLQPEERPVLEARRHGLSAVDGLLGLSLLWMAVSAATVAFALRGPGELAGAAWTVAGMVGVGYLIGMVAIHWRRATSLYVVTRERVYGARGRLRFHLTQTTYDKVTDLHLRQSLFGRWWGYGTVIVQTAGTGLRLAGVRDPVAFKARIEEQREAFIRELVGRARPVATGATIASEPTPPQRSLWEGRPSPASIAVAFVFAVLFFVVGVVLFSIGLAVGRPMVIGGGVMAGFALLSFWPRWLLYRYSRFEVTSRGVALQKGWLSRRRVEATYSKVTDVAVAQDILGRILGYGTITINTAGSNEAPVVFAGVPDPESVKATIDAARGGRSG